MASEDGAHDPELELPIKLGPCSNGEYDPVPLGTVERETIRRTRLAADDHARRLGLDRRTFLRSVSGAALMLLTLDACHSESRKSKGKRAGGQYRIPPESSTEPGAARGAIAGEELVFDVQNHFLEYDPSHQAGGGFATAFPQARCGDADPRSCFSIEHYLEEIFLKSDTSMAVISAVPIPGAASPLSIDQMERARRMFAAVCGDGRLLLHGGVFPQLGALPAALDGMTALAAQHPIAAWKVYTHLPGRWWLDDHEAGAPRVGNAFLDRAGATGVRTVCVHKGFGSLFGAANVDYASPVDVGPAAKAHPDLRFVVYHSGFEPGSPEGPYTEETAGVGVNRLVKTVLANGIGPGGNVYAELGSTWWNLMRDPTRAAHVLGKLLVHVGPDNVLWGTDSIWYGSPQDQIQAFRAFEIVPELQERFGYPALTPELKRKILGQNAARLYGIKPVTDKCTFTRQELEQVRQALPSPHRTYGPRTTRAVRELLDTHGIV
jgi:uncharacterized protein